MDFEWDADKAQKNLEKHGIRFEIAAAVFIDPNHITAIDDRFDYGEERYVTLGLTYDGFWWWYRLSGMKAASPASFRPAKPTGKKGELIMKVKHSLDPNNPRRMSKAERAL